MEKDLKKAIEIIRMLLDDLPWHPDFEKDADKAEAFVRKIEEKYTEKA